MDLARDALANAAFKRVVVTTHHTQVTVMHLAPGEDIGDEAHADYDQLMHVVSGNGTITMATITEGVGPGSIVLVPGGFVHNVRATHPTQPLKLVVVYAPPKFARDAVFATRAAAADH